MSANVVHVCVCMCNMCFYTCMHVCACMRACVCCVFMCVCGRIPYTVMLVLCVVLVAGSHFVVIIIIIIITQVLLEYVELSRPHTEWVMLTSMDSRFAAVFIEDQLVWARRLLPSESNSVAWPAKVSKPLIFNLFHCQQSASKQLCFDPFLCLVKHCVV